MLLSVSPEKMHEKSKRILKTQLKFVAIFINHPSKSNDIGDVGKDLNPGDE